MLLATPTRLSMGQSYASLAFSRVSTQFTNPSPRSPSNRGILLVVEDGLARERLVEP